MNDFLLIDNFDMNRNWHIVIDGLEYSILKKLKETEFEDRHHMKTYNLKMLKMTAAASTK